MVEPRPGKSVITSSKVFGDSELICIRIGCTGFVTEIARSVPGGTTSDNRVNHFELAVLRRLEVRRERNLARATTVSGATLETQLLCRALRHGVPGTLNVEFSVAQFAREIRSEMVKREIFCACVGKFEWFRCNHDHVRGNGAGEGDGRSHEDRLGRRHVGVVVRMRLTRIYFVPDEEMVGCV